MDGQTPRVGTIIGRGKNYNELEMAVAFHQREAAPKLGGFVVLEEQGASKRRLLCRVEDLNYGDFQTTQDARKRAIVEQYIRGIEGFPRELTEEEKKGLFFLLYVLKVLGDIRGNEIVTDYRLLPELTMVLPRYPTREEYAVILGAGIEVSGQPRQGERAGAFEVGHLALGASVDTEQSVRFDQAKFEARRTAIFAQTGYGKTNLCKIVVSMASLRGGAGILVLDINGEYTFRTFRPDGSEVPGLADIKGIKDNLAVYTDRPDVLSDSRYKDVYIHPILNLEFLQPYQVARLFDDQDLAIVKDFRNVSSQAWRDFVVSFRTKKSEEDKDKEIDSFITKVKRDVPEPQRNALARNMRWILPLDRQAAGNTLWETIYHLARGRVVVLDLSLTPLDRAILLSQLVLEQIFRRNVEGVTTGQTINAIAVFEEAQNVLTRKAVEEGQSIFVRWAKEGRKFGLGLIYVTQQPGAIADEIVSQTENYFVMHLLNDSDIKALTSANKHYAGITAELLGDETIVGNAYVYSAPYQPFVFPAKVHEFSESFIERAMQVVGKPLVVSVREEMRRLAEQVNRYSTTARGASQPNMLGGGAGIGQEGRVKIGLLCYRLAEFFDQQGWRVPFTNFDEKHDVRMDWDFTRTCLQMLEGRKLIRGQLAKFDDGWYWDYKGQG